MNDIDAVVTWVDGNDPSHINKRLKYIEKNEDKFTVPSAKLDTRFDQVNEVKYCIYSIRKYASWIRNIYLVTDNQCPHWLTNRVKDELGVIVIDHSLIFRGYEEFLPTFNSRSINTMLWRIPDLSNKYIYFNDDIFLTNNVDSSDFFTGDKVITRGEWKKIRTGIIYNYYKKIFGNTSLNKGGVAKVNAAIKAGFNENYFSVPHVPHAMRKDVQKRFYEENPNILYYNIKYKFRNLNQYVPITLFLHLAFKNECALKSSNIDYEYISPSRHNHNSILSKLDLIKNNQNKFLCVQSMEKFEHVTLTYLKRHLNEICM
jgi:hypothetical protein